MAINLMSWDTALYKFNNKLFNKKSGLGNENFSKVYERITEYTMSVEVLKKVHLDFIKKAYYYGLHDLELDLAVQKVGSV